MVILELLMPSSAAPFSAFFGTGVYPTIRDLATGGVTQTFTVKLVALAALAMAFASRGLPAPAGAEREAGGEAPRQGVKLLENVGSPLQVHLVGESSGAAFSDANCYLICDRSGGEAMVIDAGTRSAPLVLKRAEELGVRITLLVSTHFHGDHTGGNALILERTPAKMVVPAKEAALIAGDELKFGGQQVRVIEIGGHSPGGICLHFPAQKLLFAGDALLKGSIARVGI